MVSGKIAVLAGDGIGPEVMEQGLRLLDHIAAKHGHTFEYHPALIGGIAIDETGSSFPDETREICGECDAILLAAVGGPKWSDPSAKERPERGLLAMRQAFGLFANLRPVKAYPALAQHAPLRPDLLKDVDILFVRELTGGVYFGPRQESDGESAYDTMLYSRDEVERLALVGFRAAQLRKGKLTSVDKANVLASMRLWRQVVVKVHEDFQDVELEHVLVDACTMHLLTRPQDFDVIIAGNLFGDILSDEASVLAGSLGMLPSAAIGSGKFGLYEPVHGSAPDIAGMGKANPIAMILSVAMMLRYSFQLEEEAHLIEQAVDAVLEDGLRTADIKSPDQAPVSTTEMADAIIAKL
ncbi:3-isopropylmalate dehydrogenase [Anaerolineales bacterium]